MAVSIGSGSELKTLRRLANSETKLFARLAEHAIQAGETKQAAKLVVKGLQQYADSVTGWLVKGQLHLHLKQSKLARSAFEKALSIDSELPSAHRHCAELAQAEGDTDAYLSHLRELARLDPLDENTQGMLQAALLKKAAVDCGLYSATAVERMMPMTLRQALLRSNSLPPELARKTERFAFPENIPTGLAAPDSMQQERIPPQTRPKTVQEPARQPEPKAVEKQAAAEKPVWHDPEVQKQIIKQEEEGRDRYVRVSWADAVTSQSTTPLVEVDSMQFDASAEVGEDDDLGSVQEEKPPEETSLPEAEPPLEVKSSALVEELPAAAQPVTTIPEKPARKPLIEPYIPVLRPLPGKSEPSEPPPPAEASETLEPMSSDWEGATPTPMAMPVETTPLPAVAKRSALEEDKSKRPRLTPDIKLPPMRALDEVDDDDETSPIRSRSDESRKLKTEIEPGEKAGGRLRAALSSQTASEPTQVEIKQKDEKPVETPAKLHPAFAPEEEDEPPTAVVSESMLAAPVEGLSEPKEVLPQEADEPVESKKIELPKPPQQASTPPEPIVKPADVAPPQEEPPRIPRDDSPINRLLHTKKDEPAGARSSKLSSLLTHFEQEGEAESKPVQHVTRGKIQMESTIGSATGFDSDQPPPLPAEPWRGDESEMEPLPPKPTPSPLKDRLINADSLTATRPAPARLKNLQLGSIPEVADEELVPFVPPPVVELPPPPPPPDLAAREEAIRQKLAAIAEEVTGKVVNAEETPPPPPPEDSGGDYRLKGKIATKTLAELYASQGDWSRAVEVYEILLEKFPTNEAYRKRLETLRSKLVD
jgi:tetratricopeptide (TPR) repeat protein